jgi:hypothetical protein
MPVTVNPFALLRRANAWAAAQAFNSGMSAAFASITGNATITGSFRKVGLTDMGSGTLNMSGFYLDNQKIVGVKAWAKFNTVTSTSLTASMNVSSLTDNGTGDTTINLTTAFPNANYCVTALAEHESTSPSASRTMNVRSGGQAAGSCRVISINGSGTAVDLPAVHVAMIGDI